MVDDDQTKYLDEAIIGRILAVQSVFIQHFAYHVSSCFSYRQQQRLVRHITAQRLAVNLNSNNINDHHDILVPVWCDKNHSNSM